MTKTTSRKPAPKSATRAGGKAAPSRIEQRELTRQRILEAATRSFALQGYGASSIDAIARAAGVKKALVQYHFKTKDNLWKSAVAQLWASRDSELPPYKGSDGDTPQASQALAVYQQVVAFTRTQPAWLHIMFHEAAQPGPRLQWLLDHCLRSDFELGIAFVQQAQRDGIMPEGHPLDLLLMMSGALTYLLMVAPLTQRVTGEDYTAEDTLERYLQTFSRMLQQASRPQQG